MKKTGTYFLIHNYNTVPDNLTAYCENYEIVDCSDQPEIRSQLEERKRNGANIHFARNTGHNITTYFGWFADHYNELPEVIMLAKGNMIGRHVSQEYFDEVYTNTYFTYLYDEKTMRPRYSKPSRKLLEENGGKDPNADSIAMLTDRSRFLELNNSWYMNRPEHTYRYFATYDEFLQFVYKDAVIPKYVMFSPGACYIVRREQILKHSREFYRNLNKIMNYTLTPGFPAEAYLVERCLPTIFEEAYEENSWMNDPEEFDAKLKEAEQILAERRKSTEARRSRHKLLRRVYHLMRGKIEKIPVMT